MLGQRERDPGIISSARNFVHLRSNFERLELQDGLKKGVPDLRLYNGDALLFRRRARRSCASLIAILT